MTLIWDWNGTLLDDVALCSELINEMLTIHGYPPVGGIEAYRNVFCFPIETYYRNAGFDFARHPYPALAKEYMTLYTPRSRECPLQPQAQQTLTALQQRGIRQVILSASPRDVLTQQVTQRGIASCFDTLLGLGDVYARSKIELGRAWMADSGVDPAQAIMVGDSVHDWEVAQALGASCILYSGGHQHRAVLEATGTAVVDQLSDILQMV